MGCCRLVYNRYLDISRAAYAADRTSLTYTQWSADLTAFKKENAFLNEADSIALQQSLRHLSDAYKNFFKERSGFPKFKSKHKGTQTYTTKAVNGNIRIEKGCIKIPKVGWVKIRLHRTAPDTWILKGVTVEKAASGRYYVSVLYEYNESIKPVSGSKAIGLDFSMRGLYCDSEGQNPEYPRYYRTSEERLAREQRKLSHMERGSSNYKKQRLRVAELHEKVSNQRKDFLHKISKQIADEYDIVCIEDLDMKAMARRFGKSVNDDGWGMFVRMLDYKLADRGKRLIKTDKWYPSSQTCSVCGYKNPAVKDLSVRHWTCPECDTTHDRDINAAVNIKNEAMRSA